jgi:hypothetical protein
MKAHPTIRDYYSLKEYIQGAMREYGPALNRVIVSNDVRLHILEREGIDVNSQPVLGISVIAEPFLPEEEVQVVLGEGPPTVG